jgi:hypothetical protein
MGGTTEAVGQESPALMLSATAGPERRLGGGLSQLVGKSQVDKTRLLDAQDQQSARHLLHYTPFFFAWIRDHSFMPSCQ